jgi:hypothetical protein
MCCSAYQSPKVIETQSGFFAFYAAQEPNHLDRALLGYAGIRTIRYAARNSASEGCHEIPPLHSITSPGALGATCYHR